MKIITLLTDFGLRDGYQGVLKGVIWRIAPEVQIADITHSIEPQNVLEGALTLGRAALFFPPGTIHVAVVDPGVGTKRRPLAARIGEHFFVGPDNGLCTLLARHAGVQSLFIHLDQTQYWLHEVSHVFHGRDIFAPVAAHLANGAPLEKMGSIVEDIVLLQIPQPEPLVNGWRGTVMHVDRFGNLSTNLSEQYISNPALAMISVKGVIIQGVVNTYADRQPGQLVCLFDSSGVLSIGEVNGNAAERLHAQVGDVVEVIIQ